MSRRRPTTRAVSTSRNPRRADTSHEPRSRRKCRRCGHRALTKLIPTPLRYSSRPTARQQAHCAAHVVADIRRHATSGEIDALDETGVEHAQCAVDVAKMKGVVYFGAVDGQQRLLAAPTTDVERSAEVATRNTGQHLEHAHRIVGQVRHALHVLALEEHLAGSGDCQPQARPSHVDDVDGLRADVVAAVGTTAGVAPFEASAAISQSPLTARTARSFQGERISLSSSSMRVACGRARSVMSERTSALLYTTQNPVR